MIDVPAALVPTRASRSLQISRCYAIVTTNASSQRSWFLTDNHRDVVIVQTNGQLTTHSASNVVISQPKRRQSGVRSNSTELQIGLDDLTGVTKADLDKDLLIGARVVEVEVDAVHTWIIHRLFSWYVSDVRHGKGIAILSLVGISSKFQNTIGESITTRCQNKFFNFNCNSGNSLSNVIEAGVQKFGFRQYKTVSDPSYLGRRSVRIRMGADTDSFPASSLAYGDWWAHGTLKVIDGPAAGQVVYVESNNKPFIVGSGPGLYVATDLILATPLAFNPTSNNTVELRTGCARFLSVCREKFNNLDNFRGDRDVAGSDNLQRTPGAE